MESTRKRIHYNISNNDLSILSNLTNDASLVIKEADKGRARVVISKHDYCEEIQRQLNDKDFYFPVQCDPTNHVTNIIKITINEAMVMGYINEITAKFLTNSFPRVPIFYTLPKIHKPGVPPSSRPIMLGCSSLLEPLSKY